MGLWIFGKYTGVRLIIMPGKTLDAASANAHVGSTWMIRILVAQLDDHT